MTKPAGWSDALTWQRATARNALRRAIASSQAARTLSVHNRLTVMHERLERNRKALQLAASALPEDASEAEQSSLTQQILRYYSEIGELERDILEA